MTNKVLASKQSADSLVDGTTNKAFLATERTKLTGIATGATANSTEATAATASTLAKRDASANLLADAFIPSTTSTVTAAGSTTLTVDSTEVQFFTGSTTQVVVLPSTSIVAGQQYTIVNQSTGAVSVNASGGSSFGAINGSQFATFIALQGTPTTTAHWAFAGPFLFTGAQYSTASVASTTPRRDAQANLLADAFIPGFTTIATAAGTTTLTVDSTQVQLFTGSTTQTVILPTTSVVAGQSFTIANQSSGAVSVNASAGGFAFTINGNTWATFTALQATPTLPTHWAVIAQGLSGWTGSQAALPFTFPQRDAQANLLADAFIPGFTSTVTAAGATTLTVDSTEVQVFTGSTTQTVVLPTTTVAAGQRYTFVNLSTAGAVTIQPSGGGTVVVCAFNCAVTVIARQATPTTTAHWTATGILPIGDSIVTLAGTQTLSNKTLDTTIIATLLDTNFVLRDAADPTKQVLLDVNAAQATSTVRTIILPAVNSTLATLAGTETLTNKTLTSPAVTTPTGIVKGDVGLGSVDNTSDATKNTASATLSNKIFDTSNIATLLDTNFVLRDNGDATKQAKFEVAGLTTGTIRTYTFPDADTTLVGIGVTQTLTGKTLTSPVINTPTGIVKGDVGLGSVDNTSDATKNAASVTLTNKTLTSPVINTPTGIVKGDVGLGNVDNTSDITKNLIVANTQTASYTLVLGDATKAVEMNVATANNLTIPLNSSVAFPIGTVIEIFQYGAGQTSIVATGGVTIRSTGSKLKLTGQYSGASLRKRATDEWVLVGDIAT